jgi:hypothetical protein
MWVVVAGCLSFAVFVLMRPAFEGGYGADSNFLSLNIAVMLTGIAALAGYKAKKMKDKEEKKLYMPRKKHHSQHSLKHKTS